MIVICYTIAACILESLVDKGLLDVEEDADIFDFVAKFIMQDGNASFQVSRYTVGRHEGANTSWGPLANKSQTGTTSFFFENAIPHNFVSRCKTIATDFHQFSTL